MEQVIQLKSPDGKVIEIDFVHIKKANQVIRSINHKLRQSILKLLEKTGPISVTDIQIELRLDQSLASQHLGILRRSNIVKAIKKGKIVYYSLNEEGLSSIWNCVTRLLP